MLEKFSILTANILLAASCLGSRVAFGRAGRNRNSVVKAQERLLMEMVRRAAETEFGRENHFCDITCVTDYQRQVPIGDYANHEKYTKSIAAGTQNVLTSEQVELLQPSSGSTAASKYIPYTKRLRSEFMRGVKPWLADLFLHRPSLWFGPAYWAITPAGKRPSQNAAGTPIGFDEDSGYFGFLEQWLLKRLLVVPDEVAQIESMPAFQYVTLLFMLAARDLRLISMWNPSLLPLLLQKIPEWADSLLNDLNQGTITPPDQINTVLHKKLTGRFRADRRRADELAAVFRTLNDASDRGQRFSGLGTAIWPRLCLLSCWCDGDAVLCLPELKTLFPGIEIQPKGLLATEGIVSFPLLGHEGGPLAVRSHFFEFLPCDPDRATDNPKGVDSPPQPVLLAHQLEVGSHFSVIMTTSGGLYRYRLYDIIRVAGYRGGVPLVRFISKEDNISDVAGEKLNAAHVQRVLAEACEKQHCQLCFSMLAPERTNPEGTGYVLFVQVEPGKLVKDLQLQAVASQVEDDLRQNFHYDYCRRLGQLLPLRIYVLDKTEASPTEKCLTHLAAAGKKLGVIKLSVLQKDLNWTSVFRGRFLDVVESPGKPARQ